MTLLEQNGTVRGHDEIVAALERAGRTLLALPNTGPSTRLVQSGLEWVRDVDHGAPPTRVRIRPPVPDAASISQMDEVLGWIPLISVDRYVLRRIVGARSLVNPMTDRHLFSWRRLGSAMGADHKAVKRWHAQGIGLIAAALRAGSSTANQPCLPKAARHHRRADA